LGAHPSRNKKRCRDKGVLCHTLEEKSVCAFKLISQFLDKREHSRTKPTQRQRAPSTMICVPPNRNDRCVQLANNRQALLNRVSQAEQGDTGTSKTQDNSTHKKGQRR
jgi:hypothetical protein